MIKPIKKDKDGFTLIELLVVIAIIGALSGMIVNTLFEVRSLAQDSVRVADMREIQKALFMYHLDHGAWPSTINDACTGQDVVIDGVNYPNEYGDGDIGPCGDDDTFIPALVSGGYLHKVPVDPVGTNGRFYSYKVFPAGSYGCDSDKGSFYVLKVHMIEKNEGNHHEDYEDSPGWVCDDSLRFWNGDADWVTGAYER